LNDTTFDDPYLLGGYPRDAQQSWHTEAATFPIQKVQYTNSHRGGVPTTFASLFWDYCWIGLHALDIPRALLIFPGEGHSLSKNSWHGKIKSERNCSRCRSMQASRPK
jgi:hypothetical protein